MTTDLPSSSAPDWTWERLRAISPDPQALSRGRGLYFSNNWRELGGDGQWLWGIYLGRYGRPVEVAVEIQKGYFQCNCRYRARPCPHGIALLLFLINGSEKLRVGNRPEWVGQLASPTEVPPKKRPPTDERRAKRLSEMTAGVSELRRWLNDLLRNGLADVPQHRDQLLDFAARMQDFKLGSIARRIRSIPQLLESNDWPDLLLEELGRLYFFTESWANRDRLPTEKRWELAQLGGLNLRKEEVYQRPPINDRWLVLGKIEGEEELRFRRVYLRGEQSQRIVQLLDFAHGQQPMPQSWATGGLYRGAVFLYPGSSALRALFPEPVPDRAAYDGLEGLTDFMALNEQFGTTLSTNPWLYSWPVLLDQVRPQQLEQQFFLIDTTEAAICISAQPDSLIPWKLLAISGGQPLSVFGEWTGHTFFPLSAVFNNRLIEL